MKRILLLIITLLILISCEKGDDTSSPITGTGEIFIPEYIDLPEKFIVSYENYGERDSAFILNDTLYILGYKVVDRDEWITEPLLYTYDLDSGLALLETITPCNENASIDHIAFDSSLNRITIETVDNISTINKISEDGTIIFNKKIEINVIRIAVYNETIYITDGNSMFVIDENGDKIGEISYEGLPYKDFDILNNGKVFIYFSDENTYRYINDDMTLSDPITKHNKYSMMSGVGYSIYYYDNNSLYGYDESDDSLNVIMNWSESETDYAGIYTMMVHSPDKVVYTGSNRITSDTLICILTKADEDYVPAKKTIDIVYFTDDSYMLTAVAANFNRTNNNYNVNITNYDLIEGYQKLNNEIAAGIIPDIIMPPERGLPMISYMKMGLFVDLYTLIDADSEISRDDFFKAAISTYDYNGKLYQLPSNMYIETIVGKTANIGNGESWTYKEIANLMNSADENQIVNYILNQNRLNEMLLTTGLQEFIDYTNSTCAFDTQEFIDIINIIKNMNEHSYINSNVHENDRTDFYNSIPQLCAENNILFTIDIISRVQNIPMIAHKYNFEDINFIGYPSVSGNKKTFYIGTTNITITTASDVKEGAWEFIKYFISDEVQSISNITLPTKISAAEKLFENIKEHQKYIYIDNTGNVKGDTNLTDEELITQGITRIDFNVDNCFDVIVELFNSDTSPNIYDDDLVGIVYEELNSFYTSNKTAEETANIIQSRVSIYLSEISG